MYPSYIRREVILVWRFLSAITEVRIPMTSLLLKEYKALSGWLMSQISFFVSWYEYFFKGNIYHYAVMKFYIEKRYMDTSVQ
jgi:hypothetical protein